MEENRKPKICLCLTGRTIEEDLQIVEHYRTLIDYVELRADFLEPSERFFIRAFPEKAHIPSILTVRRIKDGGNFDDGEGVRLVLIAKALSFPKPDPLSNFCVLLILKTISKHPLSRRPVKHSELVSFDPIISSMVYQRTSMQPMKPSHNRKVKFLS